MSVSLRDTKYLLAYAVPVMAFVGVALGNVWVWLTPVIIFGVVPLLELFLKGTSQNIPAADESVRSHLRIFDVLLYLNVPIVYGITGFFLWKFHSGAYLSGAEIGGNILSVGIMLGANGINVAHELGHRPSRFEQFLGQLLLLASLYLQFFVEHNGGHHRHVATPHDPATARYGQSVYVFWVKSIVGGLRSALNLDRMLMLRFLAIQIALVAAIALLLDVYTALAFCGAALVGILLLETVNYLEHYGLMRKQLRQGVYERVQPHHSWNSDHAIGRILLYELTRHSDHHYRASRKYQVLRHLESPQLPTGYPGMMLLALVPPLWFVVMNPLAILQREGQEHHTERDHEEPRLAH